jgi:hypothetical protein
MNDRVKDSLHKSWAAIFYEEVFCKIDETPFAVLYCEDGAPNAPVNVLLALEIIKHMHDVSDERLFEMAQFDYLVSYALGWRTLGEETIAPRTLYYFRERLYVHTMEHPESEDLMFGQFRRLLDSFCSRTDQKMGEQRIDTTMFMSNIKKAGRLSLAFDVLRRGLRKIPSEKLTDSLKEALAPDFKTKMLYRVKSEEKESRLNKLLGLCHETLSILQGLPEDAASNERRILLRLLEEQAHHDESGGTKAKPSKEIGSGSLQSAFDEDATYRTKSGASQSGYVLEVTETCSNDNAVQFITDYHVEPNNISDAEIIRNRLGPIAATGCQNLISDGAFYGEKTNVAAESVGVEMRYTDMTGENRASDGLRAADFEYDETGSRIVRCPNGQVPIKTGENKTQITARFEATVCTDCPMRDRCRAEQHRGFVTVNIGKSGVEGAKRRVEIKRNASENTSRRAAIEGTNSALKRKGLRKLRVRGSAKCVVVCGLKSIAQNAKRLIRFLQGGYDKKKKPIPPVSGEVCPSY